MPRAEVGSSKWIGNKMKSKGLQRLRWYCQVCEKQCRDANGFKCHVQSESHVRQMHLVGEDPKKYIEGFSRDFKSDFIKLLSTAHGEKYIGANKFYNEFIRDKEHIHMNATKWASLTEFVKYLGREGIVNVKEDEKDGLMIAWKDTSLGALHRRQQEQEADVHDARHQAGEDKMMMEMARRAKVEAEAKAKRLQAMQQKESQSPPAENKSPDAEKDAQSEAPKTEGEAPKAEAAPTPAAPVKVSFGLKLKKSADSDEVPQIKRTNVFKRARAENAEAKPVKKLKL